MSGPGILNSSPSSVNSVVFINSSIFAVELNGTTAGSGYDQLNVAGPTPGGVNLGGPDGPTLNVTVGFPSALGNPFTIIQSAGPITGLFRGLPNGGALTAGGRTLVITYLPTRVILTDATGTRSLGDFNGDAFVDIRDYGVWRQNFGAINCGNPADQTGNCNVDIQDYVIWRQHFGEGTPPGPSGPAVSPPSPVPAPSPAPGRR